MLNPIRHYFIRQRIHQAFTNKAPRIVFSLEKLKHIGILISQESSFDETFLSKISQKCSELNKETIRISVLAFQKREKKQSGSSFTLFSPKDISWKGMILSNEVEQFTKQSFDVLINYFDSSQKELLLISSLTQPALTIGLGNSSVKYNDISIGCLPSETDLFVNELNTILKTING